METFAEIFGYTGGDLGTFIYNVAITAGLIHFGKTMVAGYPQMSEGVITKMQFGAALVLDCIVLMLISGWEP